MAITLQKAQTINGTRYDAFTVVTGLSAADEQRLLQGGDALPVDLGGAMSGAGSPIAYAALGTTSGAAIGERRTLSDGPDAGAEIVWSIPEGASTPTWCWAIYPLASYL